MDSTFVVLTNFYPPAQRALQYTDAMAGVLGSQLVLLHVNRGSFYDPSYALAGNDWRRDELRNAVETGTLLSQMAEQLRTPATVELTTDVLPGVARDIAHRYPAPLFVLGLPAAQRAAPAQLSTAAMELLRATNLPALLVPVDTPELAPPRRVLIAADAEDFSLTEPAAPVSNLLQQLGAELVVAHVTDTEDDVRCTKALQAVQRSGLAAGVATIGLRGYQNPDAAAGLLEAIQDTGADLVVVLARTRSYFGELFHRSVTAQVIAGSPVPVLAVPVTEPVAAARKTSRLTADDLLLWPKT
ncbi:universal stress protein [Hymenobacter koreensis]